MRPARRVTAFLDAPAWQEFGPVGWLVVFVTGLGLWGLALTTIRPEGFPWWSGWVVTAVGFLLMGLGISGLIARSRGLRIVDVPDVLVAINTAIDRHNDVNGFSANPLLFSRHYFDDVVKEAGELIGDRWPTEKESFQAAVRLTGNDPRLAEQAALKRLRNLLQSLSRGLGDPYGSLMLDAAEFDISFRDNIGVFEPSISFRNHGQRALRMTMEPNGPVKDPVPPPGIVPPASIRTVSWTAFGSELGKVVMRRLTFAARYGWFDGPDVARIIGRIEIHARPYPGSRVYQQSFSILAETHERL